MISHNQKEQLKLEAQKARHAQAMRPATMNSAVFNEPKRVQQEDASFMTKIHNVLGTYPNVFEGILKRSLFTPFQPPQKKRKIQHDV